MSENRKLDELIKLGWSLGDFKELLTEIKQLSSEKIELETENLSKDRKLEHIISVALDKLGCPIDFTGRIYAEYAIKYCIKVDPYFLKVMKEIYSETAKVFNTTTSRVQRNIRYLVEKITEIKSGTYKAIFPNQRKDNLTTKQFIYGCANYIKHNFKF